MLKRQIQYAIRKEKWYAARAKKQNRPIGEKAHNDARKLWEDVLKNINSKDIKKLVAKANKATELASKADCKFEPVNKNPNWENNGKEESIHATSWQNGLDRNLCRIYLDHKNKEVDVALENTGEIGVIQWQFGGKFRTSLKQSRNELYDHITKKGFYDILDIRTTNGWYQFNLPLRVRDDGVVRMEPPLSPNEKKLVDENERLRKAIAKIMHDLGHLLPHRH